MVIPLYNQLVDRQGSAPLYYHIAGFAIVRITESVNHGGDDAGCTADPACQKRVMGQLLAKVVP
jgi:hypothetical protein